MKKVNLILILAALSIAFCGCDKGNRESNLIIEYQDGKILKISDDFYLCYQHGAFTVERWESSYHYHSDITLFISKNNESVVKPPHP